MPPLELLWSVFRAVTALLLLFHIVFVLALFVRRNDIVDAVWGIGFVVIAAVTFPVERAGILQWAVATMTCLWAVRLSAYILYRTHGQPEDYRYRQWREQWGKWWPLYTYVADRKPGMATGQALDLNGGLWYVLAPSGKVIHTKA